MTLVHETTYLLPAKVRLVPLSNPLFRYKSSTTSSIIRAPRNENPPKLKLFIIRNFSRTIIADYSMKPLVDIFVFDMDNSLYS